MEDIAWDVIEQIFSKTAIEAGISDYNLQQKIFRDIKNELTLQIENILSRNVERLPQDELKQIILKEIDRAKKTYIVI